MTNTTRLLLTLALAAGLCPAPARASEGAPPPAVPLATYALPNPWLAAGALDAPIAAAPPAQPVRKDPWLAAALSGLTGVAVGLTGGALVPIGDPQAPRAHLANGLIYASPFFLGAGQLYAGDPGRAALVSLGAPAVVGASALLGSAIGMANRAPGDTQPTLGYVIMFGGLAAITTYGFAVWDAYATAERKNAEPSAVGSNAVTAANR